MTSVPSRVQRKRGRGWRMPDGAVYVGRPTIWGNPFRVTRSSDYHGLPGSWFVQDEHGISHHPEQDSQRSARQRAVDLYSARILQDDATSVSVEQVRAELRGRDLVCWCPRREPCHADVLLAIANGPVATPREQASESSGSLISSHQDAESAAHRVDAPPATGA